MHTTEVQCGGVWRSVHGVKGEKSSLGRLLSSGGFKGELDGGAGRHRLADLEEHVVWRRLGINLQQETRRILSEAFTPTAAGCGVNTQPSGDLNTSCGI